MTRTLQNRLALANAKVKHGWEGLSIDTIEPQIDIELRRKRPGSSTETMSDTSSTLSERFNPLGVLDSSPLAAPIFSDAVQRSGSSHGYKRAKYQQPALKQPVSSTHNRGKVRKSSVATTSWKSLYKLPESSPVYHSRHTRFSSDHAPSISFVSNASTIPNDPLSPELSEDDDEDLPVHSFVAGNSFLQSSPPIRMPQTPPPRSGRHHTEVSGEDDANLLIHLANSPTPANPGNRTRVIAPSTPPTKSTPLPSSMMSTPGGSGAAFPAFGLATPGTNLNFAEFLNMTPSPAQVAGAWARTPGPTKTPLAAREARRRLNFDSLMPPSASPRLGSFTSRSGKAEGLGMDLGGELVS